MKDTSFVDLLPSSTPSGAKSCKANGNTFYVNKNYSCPVTALNVSSQSLKLTYDEKVFWKF
jgi:hypothetical protein